MMRTKQTIAVMGATGKMGSAFSRAFSKGNYRLLLPVQDPVKTQALINEMLERDPSADVEAIDCTVDAGWEADIIVMAVPFSDGKKIAEKIKDVANQKIVISIAGPQNETYAGLVTATDTCEAEELQKLLPNSKVIGFFITGSADAFISGNDEEALQTVALLLQSAGFDPVVAGDLSVGRNPEGKMLYQ